MPLVRDDIFMYYTLMDLTELVIVFLSILGLIRMFVVVLRITIPPLIDDVGKLWLETNRAILIHKKIHGCPKRSCCGDQFLPGVVWSPINDLFDLESER